MRISMEYTIPTGTILYSGGFSSLPTDPTHYHFFTKNKNVAKQLASISKSKSILTFEVISPIKYTRTGSSIKFILL
jgi:hypothetical protein